MKKGEYVSCIIQPAYFANSDPDLLKQFPDIDCDAVLMVDLHLKQIESITDLFKDGSVFYKILRK